MREARKSQAVFGVNNNNAVESLQTLLEEKEKEKKEREDRASRMMVPTADVSARPSSYNGNSNSFSVNKVPSNVNYLS